MYKTILTSVLVVAALVVFKFFDRYTIVPIGLGNTTARHPIAYKIDRLTGKTWLVRGLDAYEVKNSPLKSPVDGENTW